MAGLHEDELYEGFQSDTGLFNVDVDADLKAQQEGQPPPDPTLEPGHEPNRQEKKQARYDEMQARLDRIEQENRELRERALQAPQAPWGQPPQQQAYVDPDLQRVDGELKTNAERIAELERRAPQTQDPEEFKRIQSEHRSLLDQRTQLNWEQMEIKRRPTPQQQADAQRWNDLNRRFPDIMGDRDMYTYASGLEARWRRLNPGRIPTSSDQDQFAEETRVAFNVKPPPVSDATKQRYSGHGVGSNGEGGGYEPPPAQVTPSEMKLAIHAYPELPRQQAIAKWYRTVKAPMLQERAERQRFSS